MKQLAALGGAESVRALKEIADHHRDDGVRGAAVELVVQAEGVADPEWLEGLLTSDPGMGIRYRLLEALAREGWSNRLDMGDNNVRQFIVYLRSLADVERHPDIRHLLVSIVAHLCGSESWTREWVLRKARDAEGPYYKIRGYAIGLSVWHDDGEFAEALSNCPTDVTGSGGEIFVQWAEQGEWERYRFHMGGWGPKM
jgi:hypothetical protein